MRVRSNAGACRAKIAMNLIETAQPFPANSNAHTNRKAPVIKYLYRDRSARYALTFSAGR
jgi:hypothetical protein